jgi:hypothetical protein
MDAGRGHRLMTPQKLAECSRKIYKLLIKKFLLFLDIFKRAPGRLRRVGGRLHQPVPSPDGGSRQTSGQSRENPGFRPHGLHPG